MRKAALLMVLVLAGASAVWAEPVRRGPILINSDQDFTPENRVIGGWGIFGDPYIISGFQIDAGGDDYGILISGTIRPVIIRDVEVLGARVAAIKVQSAKNVAVEDAWVRGSAVGISVFLSTKVQVSRVRVEECPDGVKILFSSGVDLFNVRVSRCRTGVWFAATTGSLLAGSLLDRCDTGVVVELRSEGIVVAQNAFLGCRHPARSEGGAVWDDGLRGNYWEGFGAPDKDGDGILDLPYMIGPDEGDRFPLASPPEL